MTLAIEGNAVTGDGQTAANVAANGPIDWLCLPDFDSRACFANLLGDEANGFIRLAPGGDEEAKSPRGPIARTLPTARPSSRRRPVAFT